MSVVRKKWHVKHLGFELELKAQNLATAIGWVPERYRQDLVDALAPAGLRRAVASLLDMETT
jgi:hypothetical protein